jgi:hypothetical protein
MLRFDAVAYRDAHGSVMTEADWREIAASYGLLKQGIAAR